MSVDFSKSHKAMDVEQHTETYDGFIKVTIISTAAIVVLLVLMAIFLV